MLCSFVRAAADIPDGHPLHTHGVRRAIGCSTGCGRVEVVLPARLGGKIVNPDGADVAPGNPCPALVVAAGNAAAAAVVPVPPTDAARESDWSAQALSVAPPPIPLADFDLAVRSVRDLTSAEFDSRLATRAHVSTVIGDGYTASTLRSRGGLAQPSLQTTPLTPAQADQQLAVEAIAEAVFLASAFWRACPDGVAEALRGHHVEPASILPRAEFTGLTNPNQITLLAILRALTRAVHIADGAHIEAAHASNMLAAAVGDGRLYLHGSVTDLESVRPQPVIEYMFQTEADARAVALPSPTIPVPRSLRDAFLHSRHARLSLFFRVPPQSPIRRRLLAAHWRMFWHDYFTLASKLSADQVALVSDWNRLRENKASAAAIADSLAGRTRASASSTPAAKRPRGADVDALAPSAPSPAQPTPTDVGGPAAGELQPPFVRRATGCTDCRRPLDARHTAACTWLNGPRGLPNWRSAGAAPSAASAATSATAAASASGGAASSVPASE